MPRVRPAVLCARRQPDLRGGAPPRRAVQGVANPGRPGRQVRVRSARSEGGGVPNLRLQKKTAPAESQGGRVDGHRVKDQYEGKYATGSPRAAVFDAALNLKIQSRTVT